MALFKSLTEEELKEKIQKLICEIEDLSNSRVDIEAAKNDLKIVVSTLDKNFEGETDINILIDKIKLIINRDIVSQKCLVERFENNSINSDKSEIKIKEAKDKIFFDELLLKEVIEIEENILKENENKRILKRKYYELKKYENQLKKINSKASNVNKL